jgi:sulfur carrier protein ThiS
VAKLVFTQQLTRFTATPEIDTTATTLRAALEEAFALNPMLRSYILDEQAYLRQHVVIFIDGQRVHDRQGLRDAISVDSSIHVLQALSGG